MSDQNTIRDDELFERMALAERWQHYILILSFSVLMVTGLPLLVPGIKAFAAWVTPEKAFRLRGLIHRSAAVLLIADLIWRAVYSLTTRRGKQDFAWVRPRGRDAQDAWQMLRFNLGLAERAPEFGHYSFLEKFEYWSVAWGSAIMIATGFFLWKSTLSLKLFPVWLHEVFIAVHGWEAVLAFIAILIWHMYNVHLNRDVFPMSTVWLNGKITGRELRRAHPLEFQEILEKRVAEAGDLPSEISVTDNAMPELKEPAQPK
jgi:cytochrome b subunit of formate dehydrogenase